MALLPKLTIRGQSDPTQRGLYNPMNPRHIIISIRADYMKRLNKLNDSSIKGNNKVRNMYKGIIKATQISEQNNWTTTKGSILRTMVQDRRHIDKVNYKSMEKLSINHKGVKYQIPIRKKIHTEITKWGNNKIGFAFSNLRANGKHKEELKQFLE